MSPARRDSSRTRSAARLRAAVVISRYNATVTDRLLEGALTEARTRGVEVEVFDAPGSFEVPVLAAEAVRCGRFDAVVALGCIIRGETEHDRFIAQAICETIALLSAESGVPIGLGVLTVNTPAQALARAGGKHGNKGAEAMVAALETLATIRAIRSGEAGGAGGRSIASPDKLASGVGRSAAVRSGRKGARRA